MALPPSSDGGGASVDASVPKRDASVVRDAESITDALPEVDAGYVLRGEWKPIPGIASQSCKYAVDPAKSVDPLEWENCPGRAGCKRLKVSWTPYYRSLSFGTAEPVMSINGVPHILVRRDHPAREYEVPHEMMFVAEDLTGHVNFALASRLGPLSDPSSCMAVTGSFGPAFMGFSVFVSSDSGGPDKAVNLVWAPFGNPSAITARRVTKADLGTAPLSSVHAGDSRMLIQTDSYSYGMLDTDTKNMVPPQGAAPTMFSPRPVLGGAIVRDHRNVPGLGFLANDNTLTSIYRPVPPLQVASVHLDRSDGNRLVWTEVTDVGPAKNAVWWTAPYTTDPASIQPRRVTAYTTNTGSGGVYAAVNQGLIVNYNYESVLLTRISDGWSWEIPTVAGQVFERGLWADENEVWMETSVVIHPSGNPANGRAPIGIVRFDRAALGPPTIPPS